MKVISFSVFGTESKYREGFIRNIDAAAEFYPEWCLHAYCDRQNYDALQSKISKRVRVILHKEMSNGLEGALWRYLPSLENDISTIIFRDADSVVSRREAEAVEEWLSSSFQLHLMRDHPYHESPVMGGMFGVRGKALSALSSLLQSALTRRRLSAYGDDQAFLNEEFYPQLRHTALVHTNFVRYFFEHARPLRNITANEGFIGAYANLSAEEQEVFLTMREKATPQTFPPPNWANTAVWRRIHKRIVFKHIKYDCRWCL
jgi:hypothetical protein